MHPVRGVWLGAWVAGASGAAWPGASNRKWKMYAEDCKGLRTCEVHIVVVAIVMGGAAAPLTERRSSAAK